MVEITKSFTVYAKQNGMTYVAMDILINGYKYLFMSMCTCKVSAHKISSYLVLKKLCI